MKTIEINSRLYSVPETWNELSSKQLLQVMELLHEKDYPVEKALLKLLKILTGMSWWAFFRAPVSSCRRYRFRLKNFRLSLGVFLYLSKVECTGLDEYLYLSEFLLENNNLTKNLLPRVANFYGPADEMRNLVMDEFVFCEHHYSQWIEAADEDKEAHLNALAATLYRPGRKNYHKKKNSRGDIRLPFNENLCAYYAEKETARWPSNVKMAIAHFYGACRDKWVSDNPEVFGGGSGEPAQYGLISVMRGVAEKGFHGSTLEEVGKSYVNAILMELNELVQEARAHENAMKK